MAEGQARIATNFNQREVEEIAERIKPNTGGLLNTDVSVEAPPRASGSEQAVPIESSSVEGRGQNAELCSMEYPMDYPNGVP